MVVHDSMRTDLRLRQALAISCTLIQEHLPLYIRQKTDAFFNRREHQYYAWFRRALVTSQKNALYCSSYY